jgi:hypothetical protein
MTGNGLQVLVDGEIVLLLRGCDVAYSEYYHAITHANCFPDGNSVDRGVGYGRTPDGRALEMKYRVIPSVGLELREIRALTDQDYTRRLNRALARRAR